MRAGHRCLCVFADDDGRVNDCGRWVESIDQPMCDLCLERGHDTSPYQVPLSDPRRTVYERAWG